MIKCSKHNLSPKQLVCPHIEHEWIAQSVVKTQYIVKIFYGESPFRFALLFCQKCSNKYKFPESKEIITDEDEDIYAEALSSITPVCSICCSGLLI